jgi:hypothetical protein
MIIISHRGNLSGPDPWNENKPSQIKKALNQGYHVEVDVWKTKEGWYLGHDKPQFRIAKNFLRNPKLWCHAKNLAALGEMIKETRIHCFWHEKDSHTLTSKNIVWTYPKKKPCRNSILVSKGARLAKGCMKGVCTDFPARYRKTK